MYMYFQIPGRARRHWDKMPGRLGPGTLSKVPASIRRHFQDELSPRIKSTVSGQERGDGAEGESVARRVGVPFPTREGKAALPISTTSHAQQKYSLPSPKSQSAVDNRCSRCWPASIGGSCCAGVLFRLRTARQSPDGRWSRRRAMAAKTKLSRLAAGVPLASGPKHEGVSTACDTTHWRRVESR